MNSHSHKTREDTNGDMGRRESSTPELKREESLHSRTLKMSRTYAHADPTELLALANESCEHYKAERRGSNPFVDPASLVNARLKMKTRDRKHRHSPPSSIVDGLESSSHRRTRGSDHSTSTRRRKARDSLDGMGPSHHKTRGGTRRSKNSHGLDDFLDGPPARSKKGSSHSASSRTSRIRDDMKVRISDHSRRSNHERKHKHRNRDDEDSDEKSKQRSMSPKLRSSGSRQSSARSSMNDSQDLSLSPKRTRASTRQSSVRNCKSEQSLSPKRTSGGRPSSRRNPDYVEAEDIARKQIEKQQRAAIENIKARIPKRLSLEDDDMFTMFRWSTDSLHDTLKVDYEREEFAKARKQESQKRLEPLTVQSVFSEEDLELIPTEDEKLTRPSFLRRLSNSVNNVQASPDKTSRRGSFFGRLMRRASTTLEGLGASSSDTMVESEQSK